ncbi:enediyne antibiotic chromoprotein [Couchioplanes azureus]|uniref:enediyne antibiotic chromoprotein n=1 Tax=Couchioplanes caeruleus TaxID=56438 RepID=UPI001670F127|nr:enediyne antibiotic chromoprotein [Couchioplanes caeruleus]
MGTALAALAIGMGVAASPASAAAPQVTVDPAQALQDGQSVTVAGSGFAAGAELFVGQCKSVSESICNAGDVAVVAADEQGSFSLTLTVRRAYEGVDVATNQPAGTVDCSGDAKCVITVGDSTTWAEPVALSFSSSL